MLRHFFLVFSIFFTTATMAAESLDFGDYTVDHTTFPSTLIDAEIAKTYGIKRSKYETLLNVFVSKKGTQGGVEVNITGTATNLLGQQQNLRFLKIKEENTVYYIAPVRVTGEDLMKFKITCTLLDDSEQFDLGFSKTLYKD